MPTAKNSASSPPAPAIRADSRPVRVVGSGGRASPGCVSTRSAAAFAGLASGGGGWAGVVAWSVMGSSQLCGHLAACGPGLLAGRLPDLDKPVGPARALVHAPRQPTEPGDLHDVHAASAAEQIGEL